MKIIDQMVIVHKLTLWGCYFIYIISNYYIIT